MHTYPCAQNGLPVTSPCNVVACKGYIPRYNDPMVPMKGDIYVDYTGELVEVMWVNTGSIQIEGEDGVPVTYTIATWFRKVQEGIYAQG